ncbi:MAG: photosystem I reaction center subunit IX [Limnoraphis sp.]
MSIAPVLTMIALTVISLVLIGINYKFPDLLFYPM